VLGAFLHDAVDCVKVKLTKSGGVRNACQTLTVTQGYGSRAMVDCMVEGNLGVAAGLSVASCTGNVKFTDLDGFRDLTKQPFEMGQACRNGVNRLTEGNGFAIPKIEKNW
jgi:L-alanine-DL-glutamate epimerase-like enolase superfamily enzyme